MNIIDLIYLQVLYHNWSVDYNMQVASSAA